MPDPLEELTTGLLLSGGIDSAVLLAQFLECGWQIVPFYVRTGCVWELHELGAARRFLAKLEQSALLASRALRDLVVLDMPLADLYGEHWSLSGESVPDDRTRDEAVYLPGHNPIHLI